MMKILFILMPITAVWLLSANEQGLIGTWAVWTSLGLGMLMILVQNIKYPLLIRLTKKLEEIFCKEEKPTVKAEGL